MKIPSNFQRIILNNFGEEGAAWLRQLPLLVEKYFSQWSLKSDGEFANLTFNYAVPVLYEGKPAVLKLGPHPKGRAREALALQNYDGHGTVRLLKESYDDGVLLIERVTPGTSLAQSNFSNEEQTLVCVSVIEETRRTHLRATSVQFPHISIWGLGFEKYSREYPEQLQISERRVLKADRLFKQLVRTSPSETLLHGDLHHFNILEGNSGWLAIDPKGVWGDPCYEVGAFLRNPMPELLRSPHLADELLERMQIFSEELGFDLERIWGWSYSQGY